MRTFRLPALLALALVAAQAGCHKKDAAVAAVDAGSPPLGLTADQASKVLARVGDRVITLGDYAATLERMDAIDRLRFLSADRRKELLDEIVNVALLAEDAKAKGLDKEPETEEAIREILRDALLFEAKKGVRVPADIPADEVRAYYEAHKDDFREPERRRVAQILVKDEATAQKLVDAAKKATPMQWGELVQKNTIEPVPKVGSTQPVEMLGDLGLVGAPGDARGDNKRVAAPVRAALYALKDVGDVYDKPVKTDGGWAVVRMTGRTEPHERTLAESDCTIRVTLLQNDISDREKKLEAELRQKFPVVVDDKALAAVTLPGTSTLADTPDAGAAPQPAPSASAGH